MLFKLQLHLLLSSCKFLLRLLQLNPQFLQILLIRLGLGHYFHFRFLWLLGFVRIDSLIEFAPLELLLTHESLGFEPVDRVVRTLSSILEIHDSLNRYHPAPFLVAIPGAKVVHLIIGSQLEASRDHIIILSQVAFIVLDITQV